MWDLIVSVPDHFLSFYFAHDGQRLGGDMAELYAFQVLVRIGLQAMSLPQP